MITDKFNKLKLTATAKTPISSAGTNSKNCPAITGKDGSSQGGEVKGGESDSCSVGCPQRKIPALVTVCHLLPLPRGLSYGWHLKNRRRERIENRDNTKIQP